MRTFRRHQEWFLKRGGRTDVFPLLKTTAMRIRFREQNSGRQKKTEGRSAFIDAQKVVIEARTVRKVIAHRLQAHQRAPGDGCLKQKNHQEEHDMSTAPERCISFHRALYRESHSRSVTGFASKGQNGRDGRRAAARPAEILLKEHQPSAPVGSIEPAVRDRDGRA